MQRERPPRDDPREWLNRARSSLAQARNRVSEVYLEDLCFGAQQAAEKAIKALMIARGIEFPYVHDLDHLLSLLEEAGDTIPDAIRRASELTRYATATRYPGAVRPVTEGEYAESVELAEAVVRWAEALLLARRAAVRIRGRNMSATPRMWLAGLLGTVGLADPDKRPLYAYRCSTEHFEEARDVLAGWNPRRDPDAGGRVFAVYAAEWWRRHYDGGPWAWQPLLDSIHCESASPALYEPLRNAWRWWGVKPVVLGASVRYLGTCACQGGLPLQFVSSSQSNVRRFLRALLRELPQLPAGGR